MGIRFYNLNGFFVKKLAHGVKSYFNKKDSYGKRQGENVGGTLGGGDYAACRDASRGNSEIIVDDRLAMFKMESFLYDRGPITTQRKE